MKNTHIFEYSKRPYFGKQLKVLLLVHEGYLRKKQLIVSERTRAERSTLKVLKKLGYSVEVLGISVELQPLVEKINHFEPDIVFPFLEEFHSSADLDFAPIALLESLNIPFVGSGSKGLILSRHKNIAKRRVQKVGVKTPVEWNENPKQFPVIVKSASEDASLGLHQNCVCYSEEQLKRTLLRVKKKSMPFPMVEEFVAGREIYVSLLENKIKKVFKPWELRLPDEATIASNKVKWNRNYRLKNKITSGPMRELDLKLLKHIETQSWKIFEALGLKGYGRIDFRLSTNGHLFFLEANANPNLDPTEDFARSARSSGLKYSELIETLVVEALKNKRKK